jgi:DNA mismatch repair ATPase MutS
MLVLLAIALRGTNTTERVAAGRAVLAFLNRGMDLVLVATHDIEVIELLDGTYDAHHFREQIADGSMTFDYRIHPGPSSTRNAIAMLELLEYPEELVAEALATINWQSRRAEY